MLAAVTGEWRLDMVVLNRDAVDEDEDQGNDIHCHKDRDHDILDIHIQLPPLGDSDQHPADAEFDGDDGRHVSNLEDQEELGDRQSYGHRMRASNPPFVPPPGTFDTAVPAIATCEFQFR